MVKLGGVHFRINPRVPMTVFGPIRSAFLACVALAFILSMIADFTALPAALWMVFRDKPEHLKNLKK